jgi:hypothetical protein
MYRPAAMREDNFVEIMREVVPQLIDQAVEQTRTAESERSAASKRPLESPDGAEPVPCNPQVASGAEEVLSVEEVSACQDEIDVLIAAHVQKKAAKELPASGNSPELQAVVNESKLTEWSTIFEKGAVKVHLGKRAQAIREKLSHRFIGSRFVITRKPLEEGAHVDESDLNTFKVKSRWCLQGHLDPDLETKAQDGMLQSSTLSQPGRVLLMQLLASFGWELQLGDIKGAFMEAGPSDSKYRPLCAKMPNGGIPGVPSDAVIEVTGNVYGQNDAPATWYKTFDQEAAAAGWRRSKFDCCLYTLRDAGNQLIGVMGVHVDDTAVGGMGPIFEKSIAQLKPRFPYRKWRRGAGEFCGALYQQDPVSKEIVMTQQHFAETLKPAFIPKSARPETLLGASQTRVLRGINGSLNWLSNQSRPDLSVQTSLSQQCFPKPRIGNLRDANNAVRRAKQHKDLTIRFQSIDPSQLTICCHSDAAFANVGVHTQAGYVLAFVDRKIHAGHMYPWVPAIWCSYRLPRAVSSTLGGEAQAMAAASGSVEWLTLLMLETLEGHFALKDARAKLQHRPPIYATDCKSLFDHLISPSAPTSIDDRRTSIDVVIIRESLSCTAGVIRWLPTNRMLADALTKDKADPIDLLRSCVRHGRYQISPEELVLQQQAEERERQEQKLPDVQKSLGSSQLPNKHSVLDKNISVGSEQLEGHIESSPIR